MRYPTQIKKKKQTMIHYGNRGMDLEYLINLSNSYYFEQDMALIYKKPTPIGIVDVGYTEKGKVIRQAYFKSPSTLDYNGLYRGKYVEFEAKETKNKTSFPISNIHLHQLEHVKRVLKHDGIVFFLILMNHHTFLLPGEKLLKFLETHQRKSIPYSYLMESGHLVKEKIDPPLDYLDVVDEIYFGGMK